MNPEPPARDRSNFIKTSGIGAPSAAALMPREVATQAPSPNTATLETAIQEAIASAPSAAPSPHSAVAGSNVAAGQGSGALDLSPAKWLWYPGDRTLTLTLPPTAAGELVVHRDERLALTLISPGRFALPAGRTVTIELKHT